MNNKTLLQFNKSKKENFNFLKFNDFIKFKSGVDSKNNISNFKDKAAIPWIKLGDIKNNKINFENCDYLLNETKNLAQSNDLLVCWSTNPGFSFFANKPILFSTAFYKFENKEDNVLNVFIHLWLQKYKKNIEKNAVGSTLKKVNMKLFGNILINYPSLDEQTKIANFFTLLDKQIQLIERKLELYELRKKYYLNNMFCDDDSNLPKLRFEGFESRWISKNLNKICKIAKGSQINNENLTKTGKYYYLNGGTKLSGWTNKFNKLGNTISISEGGESCGFVNYNINNFWSGGHLYTIDNLLNNINTYFLFSFLKSKQKVIMRLRVGSGLPNIQKPSIEKILINYPSLDEQTKIGNLFSSLDEGIQNVKKQKDQLTKRKTYYLNNMFI